MRSIPARKRNMAFLNFGLVITSRALGATISSGGPVKRRFETSRVFAITFSFGLFTMSARGVADPDFWWHLRSGELIILSHTLLRTDPLSCTRCGHPCVNRAWFSDVR